MKRTLFAWAAFITLWLSACWKHQDFQDKASQILDGYIWENTTTWDMAYREWTPVANEDWKCDVIQPVFDKTTWNVLWIIDQRIAEISESNWDELVILCDETESWTDAGLALED